MIRNAKHEYKKTVCPLDCPDSCGMIAKVEHGKVVSLAGDPEHPVTNGYICRKMRSYPERLYSQERIVYPQVRVGKKGEGRFQRITWDEALHIFAEKIKDVSARYGGEAILPYQYAGNMGVLNRNAGYALYHKIGASRLNETICSAAAGAGWDMHLQGVPGSPPELARGADLIVAWGINLKVTNIHFWQYVVAARKRGARLLVIDPYQGETAKAADEYLQVKPGGDGALALGVIKAMLEKEHVDRNMLARETTGFAALESYLGRTSWEEFERLSGVSRERIEALAGLLYQHPKTFIRIGIGLSRNSRGGMSVRAIVSLAAALGLFNGGSGRGVLLTSRAFVGDTAKLRFPELLAKPTRMINMAHLGHALTALTPPVRLFIVYSCNPLSVAPDASMVRLGLSREDLFTVVHEQVMTPTARYADLLLPATTFLENTDLYTGYGHFEMAVVKPVIEPVGEAKSNFDLFQEIASRLGFTDVPFRQSSEERIASYIATMKGLPEDFTYDEGMVATGWITSTRKRLEESINGRWQKPFRFVSHSSEENPQVPPIASLMEPCEQGDVELIARLPFALITPPHPDLLNSTFGERYKGEFGTVLVHPDDARSLSINDGDKVKIINLRGWSVRVARVTEDTCKGLLVATGLFWESDDSSSGINDLTSQKTTDIGDGPTYHESRVFMVRL